LKIALIGQKGIPATSGGVEYHVDRLSRELARRGHDVTVYVRTWYTPKTLKSFEGVRLVHLPTLKTKHLDAAVHSFLATWHAVWRGAEIIHYQAIGPAAFSVIPRLFGKKVVATIHRRDWEAEKWGRFARRLLHLAHAIAARVPHRTIVVSISLLAPVKGKNRRDFVVIPNGTEKPRPRPWAPIPGHPSLAPKKYLLYLGRLVPEKRADWLIRAFLHLGTARGPLEGLSLVIAGGSSGTDDYVERLKRIARPHPRIIFTGPVWGEEKEVLFSQAFLFVLPSALEGFPIALLEAQGYGLCCLASDIPPHREIVRDGETGVLFRRDDPADLEARLSNLVSRPAWVEELGGRARRDAERRMTWAEVAERTLAVYREILRPQKTGPVAARVRPPG